MVERRTINKHRGETHLARLRKKRCKTLKNGAAAGRKTSRKKSTTSISANKYGHETHIQRDTRGQKPEVGMGNAISILYLRGIPPRKKAEDRQMNTARDLIDRSISHDEITHGEYDAAAAAELSAASENGGTRNGRVTEYWGVTDGDEWRVHLDHAEVE